MPLSGLGVGRAATTLGAGLMQVAGQRREDERFDQRMAREDERHNTSLGLQIAGNPNLRIVSDSPLENPGTFTPRPGTTTLPGLGATLMAEAQGVTAGSDTPVYSLGPYRVQRVPQQPEAPVMTLDGIDAAGRNVAYRGSPEQLAGVDVRPEPTTPRLTGNKQVEQIENEALGNAVTWARSGQIGREQGVRLIASQHNIPVGRASAIWEKAQNQILLTEGRDLTNQGRENRLNEGGDEVARAIAEALNPNAAQEPAGGGIRNPIASGRAHASPPRGGPMRPDTGSQYAPAGPQKPAVERARELAAQGKTRDEARQIMIREGYQF